MDDGTSDFSDLLFNDVEEAPSITNGNEEQLYQHTSTTDSIAIRPTSSHDQTYDVSPHLYPKRYKRTYEQSFFTDSHPFRAEQHNQEGPYDQWARGRSEYRLPTQLVYQQECIDSNTHFFSQPHPLQKHLCEHEFFCRHCKIKYQDYLKQISRDDTAHTTEYHSATHADAIKYDFAPSDYESIHNASSVKSVHNRSEIESEHDRQPGYDFTNGLLEFDSALSVGENTFELNEEDESGAYKQDAIDWKRLSDNLINRYTFSASLSPIGDYVHVKKNICKIDLRLKHVGRIFYAEALSIIDQKKDAIEQLKSLEDDVLRQTVQPLKASGPNNWSDIWSLRMGSEESIRLFRDYSSETPVRLVIALSVQFQGEKAKVVFCKTDPFNTVTHIRYSPQALFGHAYFCKELVRDEDMIPFVVYNLLQAKSKREPPRRSLTPDDIIFFQNGIIDKRRYPNKKIKDFATDNRFEKLSSSNEWLNRIVEVLSIDEIYEAWNSGWLGGFLTPEAVERVLDREPYRTLVHFNDNQKNPLSLVVSARVRLKTTNTTISINFSKKKPKTSEQTVEYTLLNTSSREPKTSLKEAIHCAIQLIKD